MIVLDKLVRDADFGKSILVIAFEKKSAVVFENPWFENQRAGEGSFQNFHADPIVRILDWSEYALFQHLQKINAIEIVLHGSRSALYLSGANVSVAKSDFLRARHHQPL